MSEKDNKPKKTQKRDTRKLPQLVYDLSHIRHDPAHCLSGLFRSIKKGERKKTKLDVTYKFGKESLRFVGFEILGVDDMRFLQGLVAMAGPSKLFVRLDGTAKSEIGRKLGAALDPRENARNMYARYVNTTINKLLKEIGYKQDGKQQITVVKNSLIRMSNVTLIVDSAEGNWSSHLMSHSFTKKTNEISVALNPLVTKAILGERRYTWIDMSEVRSLKTDPARLLHERLCAWVDQGETKPVSLDKLVSYIWPSEANAEALKKRRQLVRKVIQEISSVGWKIEKTKKDVYIFTRPRVLYVNKDLEKKEPKNEI